jgi:hypothetical protein
MTVTKSDELEGDDLIAMAQPASNYHISWRERLRLARDISAIAWEKAVDVLSQTAHAQADLHLPTLAGAPAGSNITPYTCNAGTNADRFCKRCPGPPAPGGTPMRECLSLRVCLQAGGCAAANDWFIQRIGINDR